MSFKSHSNCIEIKDKLFFLFYNFFVAFFWIPSKKAFFFVFYLFLVFFFNIFFSWYWKKNTAEKTKMDQIFLEFFKVLLIQTKKYDPVLKNKKERNKKKNNLNNNK